MQRLGSVLSRPRDFNRRTFRCWEVFVYTLPGTGAGDEAIGLIRTGDEMAGTPTLLLYHPLKPGALIRGRVITPLSEERLTLSATTVRELDSPLTPVFLIGTAAPVIHHDEAQLHKALKLISRETDQPVATTQADNEQVAS